MALASKACWENLDIAMDAAIAAPTHWMNIAVALLASLAGGYALTWIDIRTDLIRSKAISGLNRALNKHQKPN